MKKRTAVILLSIVATLNNMYASELQPHTQPKATLAVPSVQSSPYASRSTKELEEDLKRTYRSLRDRKSCICLSTLLASGLCSCVATATYYFFKSQCASFDTLTDSVVTGAEIGLVPALCSYCCEIGSSALKQEHMSIYKAICNKKNKSADQALHQD